MLENTARKLVLSALFGSLVTFLIMTAMRSPAQSEIIAEDGFVMPKPPFDRIIRRLDFQDVPFRDAIRTLSVKTEISIDLQTKALDAAFVSLDAPITISLANVTTAQALDAIFENLAPRADIAYWHRGNTIEVCTSEEEQRHTITRVYDVQSMIEGAAENDPLLLDAYSEALLKTIMDSIAVSTWKDYAAVGAVVRSVVSSADWL
jgi:hypothetical protein